MRKTIYAVYPIAQLHPKNQKDLAAIYALFWLMVDSRNQNYLVDLDGQYLDTLDIDITHGINRSYAYFRISCPEVFEGEAYQYFTGLLTQIVKLDFIEYVKAYIIEQLAEDNSETKLTDKFFRENFTDFYKFRDAGTIKAVQNLTETDFLKLEKKLENTPFYIFESDRQDFQLMNQKAELQIVNNPKFKNSLPNYQTIELKALKRKMLTMTQDKLVDYVHILALEKYLRDKFNQIIDITNRVLPNLHLIKILYFRGKIEDKLIEKETKYFLNNINQFSEYLDFAHKKQSAMLEYNQDIGIRLRIDKLIFNSVK
jgi:hypothetical protein